MQQKGGFPEVNGTRLYYEATGSGHPLVLIHGMGLDTRMWNDQFECFGQHHYIIRYDLRGFGKSSLPTAESYTDADDLMALLNHLGLECSYILGLSRGGGIAIEFALEYPEATNALILADSGLQGYEPSPETITQSNLFNLKVQESGVQTAKEFWLGTPLFRPALEKPDVAARLLRIISDYSGWHWINENPAQTSSLPAIERIKNISVPTLIIVGERDLSDFHAMADEMQQRIPNARKIIIPGVGHMSNMEAPNVFNETVLSFLADI